MITNELLAAMYNNFNDNITNSNYTGFNENPACVPVKIKFKNGDIIDNIGLYFITKYGACIENLKNQVMSEGSYYPIFVYMKDEFTNIMNIDINEILKIEFIEY